MNILIPIGGKGERFSAAGYAEPKPLICIYHKEMILWVLDNIRYLPETDSVFVFYFPENVPAKIESIVLAKHPTVRFVAIPKQTCGAAETLALGIAELQRAYRSDLRDSTMVLDCDTFYRADIRDLYACFDAEGRNVDRNAVFYTPTDDPRPLFSYIRFDSQTNKIVEIREKVRISPNANTGIYCFEHLSTLAEYAWRVVSGNIRVRGECYTSCIIAEMIRAGHSFRGIELAPSEVFHLGTPAQLTKYQKSTRVCLFDLDGTLVHTDDIYYAVWETMLRDYGVSLTPELYRKSIAGNSDSSVVRQLIPFCSVDVISAKKDAAFLAHIQTGRQSIPVVNGSLAFVKQMYRLGCPIAVVSNANRPVAEELLRRSGLDLYVDFVVAAGETERPKPHPDPYLAAIARYATTPEHAILFEDSKTGLMSACAASPGCVVGIATHYSTAELIQSGANIAVEDYTQLEIASLWEYKNNNIGSLARWIRQSLRTLPISDVRVDETKRKGGFIADVYSVVLVLKDGTELACVLKAENAHESALSTMSKELGLYEREYLFYSQFANHAPVATPKYYGIIKDDRFRNVGILLGDLTAEGGVPGIDLNREPLSVSLSIIDRMARMHAAFWGKELGPEIKQHNDAAFCPKWSEFVGSRIDAFLAKWGNTLTPEQQDLAREMAATMTETQNALSREPLTLCHGDVKSANLFYRKPATGEQPDVWFIDWQYIARGKGVQDLVFFIIESFDVARARQFRALFKEYYYVRLCEHGVVGYSHEEYSRDFELAIRHFPFFVAVWFGTLDEDELIDKNFPFFYIQKLFAFLGSG
jgi:beta-phosphoglucomutase